jgi:uncharacterized membrane protein YhdT
MGRCDVLSTHPANIFPKRVEIMAKIGQETSRADGAAGDIEA